MTQQSSLYHADQKHQVQMHANFAIFSNQYWCDSVPFFIVNTIDVSHLFTWMLLIYIRRNALWIAEQSHRNVLKAICEIL